METLWHDLRHGWRVLRMRPAFTTAAIVTLAIGIGANTAIFGAVHAMLLAPLPVTAADDVVYGIALREGFDPFGTSLLEYGAIRDTSQSFAAHGMAARRPFTLVGLNQPERLDGAKVTAGFMEALGVSPVAGRRFTAQEDRPDGPTVALIGYDVWHQRFGGDAGAIGRSLRLDDRVYTIVGVMPPGFDYPGRARLWVPLQRTIETLPLDQRAAQAYTFVGRLKPGVAIADADRELKVMARRLEQDYPDYRKGWSYTVIPLRHQLLGDLSGRVRTGLLLLVTAVGFVLLICCANVASLLLIRAVAREREIAVRLTLGAGRARVVRQLIVESGLLAVAAGLAGLVLAVWIAPILATLNPVRIESLGAVLTDFRVNWQVMAFASAVSLLTGLLFGAVPALKLGRVTDLMGVLRRREQRAGGAAGGRRVLSAVIVAEVAVAVALLAGGSLVVKSFQRLQHVDLGFQPDQRLVVHLTPSPARYPSHEARIRFTEEAMRRITALPGVSAAGLTTNVPLDAPSFDSLFTVEGQPPRKPGDVPITAHRLVTPDYLQTLGVTLLKGRLLDAQDRAGAAPVVVVSEEFARQAWPDGDPIGKRVRRGGPTRTDFPWLTVVGLVADVKEDLFNFRVSRPVWYLPYAQVDNTHPLSLVVRTAIDPAALTTSVRQAIHSFDPDLPVSNAQTMTAHLRGVVATERFSAVLMSAFALIGLGLAALGLYAVIAYSVTQRTGEIGLRMALGAPRRDVLTMVLREGALLVATGLIAGLAGARLLARTIAGSLYNVGPNDAGTFALVTGALVTAGLVACIVPAWRATRIDPVVALRME
jgi:putative ABC transport system permease protein